MWKLSVTPQERLLIVSPHPDDESIGCGGLLLLYGAQADVLLITDGATAHGADTTDEECAARRRAEFEAALSLAGVGRRFALEIPDGRAYRCGAALRGFDFSPYSKIFLPNRAEEHADHRAVNECLRRALRRRRSKAAVYEYEVWSPLSYPTHYLDISPVLQGKDELISAYASQLAIRDYHAMVRGLAAYRGVVCHTQYAETYELISAKNAVKKLFYRLPVGAQTRLLALLHGRGNKG